MPLKRKDGTAISFEDLIKQLNAWVTDKTIHQQDAWEIMRSEPWPKGTIYKAHGRLDGTTQYIGLLPNKIIKGKTYWDWLASYENMATHFVWAKGGLNRNGESFSLSGLRVSIPANPKPGDKVVTYSLQKAHEPFLSSAYTLHFGVFKQYVNDLDWNEQPGGMPVLPQDYKLHPIQYSASGSSTQVDFYPPALPGTEYPSFSYDIEGVKNGEFTYIALKNRYALMLIMIEGGKTLRREVAYVGQFEPFDGTDKKSTYLFPAVVIGGTSGLVSYGEDRRYNGSQVTPSAVIFPKYDYRVNEWSLSHGIPSFASSVVNPTKDNPNDALTQVCVMLPDGTWSKLANFSHYVKAYAPKTFNAPVTRFDYLREEPVKAPWENWVRPHDGESKEDWQNLIDTTESVYALQRLVLCDKEHGLLGEIKYLHSVSAPVSHYGEKSIQGKKYYLMPNVWEGRQLHYQGWAETSKPMPNVSVDTLFEQQQKQDRVKRTMNLMICLEE